MSKEMEVEADHEHVFLESHGNNSGFYSKPYKKGLEGFEQRKDILLHLKKIIGATV